MKKNKKEIVVETFGEIKKIRNGANIVNWQS